MKTMTAKYPGTCTACGKAIARGELIQWSRGAGARHAACQASGANSERPGFHKVRITGRCEDYPCCGHGDYCPDRYEWRKDEAVDPMGVDAAYEDNCREACGL
jgi:hypothetical protein